MTAYEQLRAQLKTQPRVWAVTGVAGFIGSHLLESLLKLDQRVIGLDDFSTGRKENLDHVKAAVTSAQWERFQFVNGDIAETDDCQEVCCEAELVLHQAALGSVPRSLENPARTHRANVTGFLKMLTTARDAKVKAFVYASSSSVYGDEPALPKVEDRIGRPLSPYAATKWMNEIYAGVFARAYGFPSIGLRYFNVFGPRQDPEGAYAAVIPKWAASLLRRQPVYINGDGQTSRDFTFIENVVQANLLAATAQNPEALNQAYNVATGERTTLNDLFGFLQTCLRKRDTSLPDQKAVYRDFRPGDVRHSHADVSKAQRLLGYAPSHRLQEGLELTMDWYRKNCG